MPTGVKQATGGGVDDLSNDVYFPPHIFTVCFRRGVSANLEIAIMFNNTSTHLNFANRRCTLVILIIKIAIYLETGAWIEFVNRNIGQRALLNI